ncbi:MAG: mucoidy inhibitor MuiA family protein [Bacteroidales bacterium]|nr:mucoidy inhibitor MuiA family protein [Bacteroidales bacterium]
MKKTLLAVALLCGVVALQAQNTVKSRLEKVTVYPSSALVEKSVKVNLVKGENKFIITDNATSFTKDNLHFSQQEDFFITSVNLKNVTQSFEQAAKDAFTPAVYNQVISLNNKVQQTKSKINDNTLLITTYNQQLSALQNLKAIRNTQAIDTVKTLQDQFGFQREEGVKLNNLIAKARKENEELRFTLSQDEDELENLIKQHNGNCLLSTHSQNIILNVYSNRNMQAVLNYDYLVSSVVSNYAYDVNLDETMHTAVFSLKTNVQQGTNENWKDCDIVFSTNEGGWAGEDAELYTWYLNNTPQYQTANTRKYKNRVASNNIVTEKAMLMSADMDAAEAGSALEEVYTAPVLSLAASNDLTLSREYTLNTKQSVSTGDKPQTIPLYFDTTKVYFKHFSTPKAAEKVYYTALLPDWEELGLQNAACDIFLNGKYIAKSYINTNSTKDTMKFSAGEDRNVKIARKVRKTSPDKGFLSSSVEETVTVVLNVKNMKNQSVDLEIKDQIPVSQNADIKITGVDKGEGNLNSNTGILKWNVSLAPKEIKEIKFSYTVKYPKDFNVILN